MTTPDGAAGRAVTARLRGGVHKSYGPVRALDLPELDLHAGQVVGVVGENGAGKSTLMGTLAGSVHRDGGDIEIDGQPLAAGSTEAAIRLGVALVSQEFRWSASCRRRRTCSWDGARAAHTGATWSTARRSGPRRRPCWPRSACPRARSPCSARCARSRCRPGR